MMLATLLLSLAAKEVPADEAVWRSLAKPGHLVLLRHALAPGTGDPAGFQLDDCATQRNLSAGGREQARRIAEQFRQHGVDSATVYSSQWCRCLETAQLLGLGQVTPLPSINSFFRNPERRPEQTRELRQWVTRQPRSALLVLVTHQVNITALSGVFPASGEMVVMRRLPEGGLEVVGRIGNDSP
ncbi:MAG: histidine phosphatase family protein [Oceanospirillaceae bacterium]|nr:histidine phosphatase family protein [Oceanospirillaceae bacterium]